MISARSRTDSKLSSSRLPLRYRVTGYVDVSPSLWASALLFATGVFAPFLTLHKFIVFENTVSIYRTVRILWQDGEAILFAVVLGFSVLVPVLKLGLEGIIWHFPISQARSLDRLDWWTKLLSRLSMAEIFVASILMSAVKFGAWATVEIHAGVYILLGSVLAGLWTSVRIRQALHEARSEGYGNARNHTSRNASAKACR